MGLYEDLGVARGADAAAIKRAFRRKAQKAHPDKHGGDAREFDRVARAYRVLGNESRRLNYDQTGADGQAPEVSEEVAVMQMLAGVLISMIDQVDVEHSDLIGLIRQHFTQQMQQLAIAEARLRKAIRLRERACERIRRKGGGANLLASFLASDIANGRRNLAAGDRTRERVQHAMAMLDDYECAGSTTPLGIVFNSVFITTVSTGTR